MRYVTKRNEFSDEIERIWRITASKDDRQRITKERGRQNKHRIVGRLENLNPDPTREPQEKSSAGSEGDRRREEEARADAWERGGRGVLALLTTGGLTVVPGINRCTKAVKHAARLFRSILEEEAARKIFTSIYRLTSLFLSLPFHSPPPR